jgi:hypothetical protein
MSTGALEGSGPDYPYWLECDRRSHRSRPTKDREYLVTFADLDDIQMFFTHTNDSVLVGGNVFNPPQKETRGR